ncbi:hypothetical protein D3C78_1149810 [compost metagenome]
MPPDDDLPRFVFDIPFFPYRSTLAIHSISVPISAEVLNPFGLLADKFIANSSMGNYDPPHAIAAKQQVARRGQKKLFKFIPKPFCFLIACF